MAAFSMTDEQMEALRGGYGTQRPAPSTVCNMGAGCASSGFWRIFCQRTACPFESRHSHWYHCNDCIDFPRSFRLFLFCCLAVCIIWRANGWSDTHWFSVYSWCFYSILFLRQHLSGCLCRQTGIDLCGRQHWADALSASSGLYRCWLYCSVPSPMLANNIQKEMEQDSAFYARCRGLSEGKILMRYAFQRSRDTPAQLFVRCSDFVWPVPLSWSAYFSLPGLGYLIIDSVLYRDSPVIHATILFLAFSLVMFNILSDVLPDSAAWYFCDGGGKTMKRASIFSLIPSRF